MRREVTDWRAAGVKADATYVLNLYRRAFASDAKRIARERTIEALRAAGVQTVLDLWGGGASAEALVAAGFRVISVEDGSMDLRDSAGRLINAPRKRRALELAGAAGGYEVRWGKAEKFAHEADGAYLDFCGPWSGAARRAVAACRHMTAVMVTLTPDHDISTDASSMLERQMAYQLFLKMAWSKKPRWEYMHGTGGVRRMPDYRRAGGFGVFLYLLSHKPIRLPYMKMSDREKMRPDMHQRHLAVKRAWYLRNRERILEQQRVRRPRKPPQTHCQRGHPFAGENLHIDRRGDRICRSCRRDAQRRRRSNGGRLGPASPA